MKYTRTIFRYFVAGVITLLPFLVTLAVVGWLSGFLASYLGQQTTVGKLLTGLGLKLTSTDSEIIAYLLGWLIVLGIIFVTGILAETTLKRLWGTYIDNQVKKIPIIGQVYGTTRQFTDLMAAGGDEKMRNMSPVFCRFGGTTFLGLMPISEEFMVEGRACRVVVIPTAPIPFGGAVIFVPTEDVIDANISMDALMTFYVSMGASSGDFLKK